ncbi:hypothetical protein PVK06_009043 [Gossypium arboreum]|uniref:Uncharacterized protein n=1 Tax=Gossypium arboreum TaxID=29729 RepID=A0ABR0QLE1_GOSAR|nr:hypothetical protein PVK06_009043 [Gossypium arboreum]
MDKLHKVDLRGRTTRIGKRFIRTTSMLEIVGWNFYPSASHFSHWPQRLVWSTCHGSKSSASYIYYRRRREVGNFVRRDNYDNSNSVRLNTVARVRRVKVVGEPRAAVACAVEEGAAKVSFSFLFG